MSVRVAVGIAADDAGIDSYAEAASRAALGLGGAPCDLAVVFGGVPNARHASEGVGAVQGRLNPGALVGCGAQGVLGAGREVEQGGVTVWGASFPGAEIEPFALEAAMVGDRLALSGVPELDGADAVLLLVDPYTFPVEPLLSHVNDAWRGVPVIGGLASAGPGAGLLLGDEALEGGAVGIVLRGSRALAFVSQGARPVGPEMIVTGGEGNVITELASRPALERLQEAIMELDPSEQALAARGLLIGVVVDPNKPDYERGDFLIRGIVGVDEEAGSLTVGTTVHVGQAMRLQVRDAMSAHEDLVETLGSGLERLPAPPAGALLFTCNGRGSDMFGIPDHDAQAVADALSGAPTGGFFCAGEIGPVGDRSFVHGFTATLAVFPE
ncbi:MAG TPA: FIST N-terminal domain-containing protein [Thermoleophilaceae bacterium]|jgi:small ligand-binding sensory domain FIST